MEMLDYPAVEAPSHDDDKRCMHNLANPFQEIVQHM